MNNNWFNNKHIVLNNIFKLNNIHGYVLPHASTKYTGHIISHTLQFKPTKLFKKIYIIYYPSQKYPNIDKYFHEYYVPFKSLEYVLQHYWKVTNVEIIGINVSFTHSLLKIDLKKSLIVVSADFSHHLTMNKAIELENKAAHGLMFRDLNKTYMKVVDDVKSFDILYKIIPNNWDLQWIGRSRSPGIKGVGYLSFIIKENKINKIPNGIFITAYDSQMNSRECLGEWFNHSKKYSKSIEKNLKHKVIKLGQENSRLTDGRNIHLSITHYSITYLYKDKHYIKPIRGWHGIKYNSFYLPEVLLENTFNNGKWFTIKDKEWIQNNNFNISETLSKLNEKSGLYNDSNKYELYYNNNVHFKL